jgi:hypothetical protein
VSSATQLTRENPVKQLQFKQIMPLEETKKQRVNHQEHNIQKKEKDQAI